MVDEDEIKKVFSKNLMHYLISSSKKQIDLANYLNVSATTINNWIKGYKMPRMDKIDKICTFFSIRRTDLIEDKTDKPSSPTKGIRIPVLGRVAAGIPIEAITDIEDWEEIPQSMAKTGEYFALKIAGKSMEPRMMDGDVVIVRRQSDVDSLASTCPTCSHNACSCGSCDCSSCSSCVCEDCTCPTCRHAA